MTSVTEILRHELGWVSGLDNQQISVLFLATAEDCFSRLDTGHIQPPIHGYWGLLLESKEADHLPPSNIKVTYVWSYISIPTGL
jgi:hypothetical protein